MGRYLSPNERQQIEALLTDGPPPAIERRARLLLLYDEGLPTREVALQAGISRGRARYWRRRFEKSGIDILLPAPAGGGSPEQESGTATLEEKPAPASVEPVAPEPVEAATEFAELLTLQRAGVSPTDPLAEAGRKVLLYQFAEMLRHEAGTCLGEDIEELHDMRVATRRMRAAFEVFKEAFKEKALKPHLKGLRATGRALGHVRDLDVFMEKAQHYLDTLPEEQRAGLTPLLNAWQVEREAARLAMLEHLQGGEYQVFKHRFYEFLRTPGAGIKKQTGPGPQPSLVQELVPVLIYTRLAEVRAFSSCLETATLEQLHALRIEFKKLRYTLEFFREVLGEENKEVIGCLKSLQDHLGDLNDANVACQILRKFLDESETKQANLPIGDRQSPEPLVAYLAYRHAERHRLMVTFPTAWSSFDKPKVRRDLALAVARL
jgi:CHAD domain-containing protein